MLNSRGVRWLLGDRRATRKRSSYSIFSPILPTAAQPEGLAKACKS